MSFWDTAGRIGFGLATGGLSELPGAVDKYITHGTQSATDAANAQRSALDQAMSRLQDFSQQQYKNRMADLDKTMSFYGPAERYLQSIYAQPSSDNGGAARAQTPVGGMAQPPPGFPRQTPTPGALGAFPQQGRRPY